MLLIGSQAAKIHHPNSRWANPRDIDIISTYEEYESLVKKIDLKATILPNKKFLAMWNDMRMEFEIAWEDSTAKELMDILKLTGSQNIPWRGFYIGLPSMDHLYALKMSHRFAKDSPHFLKTMRDCKFMRDTLGCRIPYQDWLESREKETYGVRHPRLNTSKKDFFTGDSVSYRYDHDSIHEAVRHLERPAYTYYMKEGAEVMPDRDKWHSIPEHYRLFGVLEESYVLALERSQIPYGDKISPYKSFKIALSKVCTSITSGWFRAYAYENYDRVMDLFNEDYVDRFKKALEDGIVKPYART